MIDPYKREPNDMKFEILRTTKLRGFTAFEIAKLTFQPFEGLRTFDLHRRSILNIIKHHLPKPEGRYKKPLFRRTILNKYQQEKRNGIYEIKITPYGVERLTRLQVAKETFGYYRLRIGDYQLLELDKRTKKYHLSQEVLEVRDLIRMGIVPPIQDHKFTGFIYDWMERTGQIT